MKKILVLAVAAASAAALVACGPDSNPGTASPGGGGGGKKATCDAAPPSMIKETLGLDVKAPEVTDNDTVIVCTYSPATGIGTVLMRIQTDQDADGFKRTRESYKNQNMTTQDFPGFGDEAYTNVISAMSITTNTLVARKGNVEILVSSPASFDQEKALEQKVFDALVG